MKIKTPTMSDLCLLITPDKVYAFPLKDQKKIYEENDIPEEATFLDLTFAVNASKTGYFVIQ